MDLLRISQKASDMAESLAQDLETDLRQSHSAIISPITSVYPINSVEAKLNQYNVLDYRPYFSVIISH